MARYDDLDTTAIAQFAVVSSVVLLILILAGRALAYGWAHSYEEARSQTARYTVSDREIERQKALLADYATLEEVGQEGQDGTKRFVIPVSRALELVGQELGSQSST
jgi:hypothetical protein